jgi:flagellar motility protein MotE (MotC chaperone)
VRSLRLIPVVIAAAGALLAFKAIGLMSGHGYILGDLPVLAQTQQQAPAEAVEGMMDAPAGEAESVAAAGEDSTELQLAAAENPAAAEQMFADGVTPDPNEPQDAIPVELTLKGERIPLRMGDDLADTELQVLERLGDRREELEQFAADLAMREKLVEAAEKRLEIRIAELQDLEAEVNALVEKKKQMDDEQFQSLVAMYETMKSKEAATIFDQLGIDVLVRLVQAMNPRKMAPILADMSPEKAELLTVRLANIDPEPRRDPATANLDALPQIVGQ